MEGSWERGAGWRELKDLSTLSMEERTLIPGRIILQVLTMRNSFHDLPPSSKITGFVSISVEFQHQASGHRTLIGYFLKDDFNVEYQ